MAFVLQKNIPLASYTTLGVGGEARYFAEVHSEAELIEAYAFARTEGLPVLVIGGGSNILVSDEGVDALVVRPLLQRVAIEPNGDDVTVSAGAGVVLDALIEQTVAEGIWGLENLSAIPGSVGAMPIQNVGAYGVEAKDVVRSVKVYDHAHDMTMTLSADACAFGYRDSLFKRAEGKDLVVLEVELGLTRKPSRRLAYKDLALHFGSNIEPQLHEIRDAVKVIRAGKFPDWRTIGTAGSFFKNPIISHDKYVQLKEQFASLPGFPQEEGIKVSLGWILDKVLGLRGYRVGTVGLYEAQALVLVNHGGATASDILAFSESVIKKVYDATGIRVEREVVVMK